MKAVWDVLYQYGVGRRRQRPRSLLRALLPAGPQRDSRCGGGITEYIVGTGGAPLYDFGPTPPNSVTKFKAYGVLLLHPARRRLGLVFVEAGTEARLDFTSSLCH